MINNVVLMGRLTRDPETRYAGDSKVANFTLAVDRSVNRQTGERITDFIRCAAWGRTADFVQQWFSKGMMAIVTGQIETHTWTDKDGKTRLDTTVHARTVQFGESKKARAATGQPIDARPAGGLPMGDPRIEPQDFAEMPDDDSDVPF